MHHKISINFQTHISLPQLAGNVIIQNHYHLQQLTFTLTEISAPNRQLNHAIEMTTYFQIHRQARTYLSKGLLLLHWKYWMYPETVLSARDHWSELPYDPDTHCRCSVKNLQLQMLDGVVVSSTARNLKQVLKIKHQYSVTDLQTTDPLYWFIMTSVIWHDCQSFTHAFKNQTYYIRKIWWQGYQCDIYSTHTLFCSILDLILSHLLQEQNSSINSRKCNTQKNYMHRKQ